MKNKYVIKSREQAGFTMLEMVVSISLIVIITAVFMANYSSNNKRSDLIMTAQKLVADLHAAQNNALGLVKYGSEVPPGGWGVHFEMSSPKRYILFADLNRPGSSEPGNIWVAESGYMNFDVQTEGLENQGARIVSLPPGIEIASIIPSGGSVSSSTMVNVTFLPPDPRTNIYNGTVKSNSLDIKLKEMKSGSTKTIRVNFLGLIEVVD